MIPYPEVTIPLGVLSLVLFGAAFHRFRQAKKVSSWPRTQGRVVSSQLEDGPSMGRPLPVVSHRAVITYTYEVQGQEWSSERVFFGDDAFATGDGARDRVRKYEPGTTVEVFYDPSNPGEAVLEPETAWHQAATEVILWVVLGSLSVLAVFVASGRR